METHQSVAAIAFAMASALAASAKAQQALYSSTAGGASSYYSFVGGPDPTDTYADGAGDGYGDDFNTGYQYFTPTGLSFYGGDTDIYQSSSPDFASTATTDFPNGTPFYRVNLAFYNASGGQLYSIQLPGSDTYGIGYHTIPASDLTQGGSPLLLVGATYFSFQPSYITFVNGQTGVVTSPPSTRPQFTLGFGTAPTLGANNPTFSAQTSLPYPNTNPIAANMTSAAGGDATQQYAAFEIDGTPYNVSNSSPLWSASGSGTWGTSSNWTYGVPNGSTYTANFDEGITANSTVTLAAAQNVGTLNFDNPYFSYTIAGTAANTLTLNASSGPGILNSWNGSQVITAPVVYSNGLTVTTFADPGPTTPSLTLPLSITATGTLTKTGAGTLAFASSASGLTTLSLPAISLTAGTIALQSNSNHASRTLLATAALSITGGVLDLGNNDLDLAGGGSAGLATLNGYIASGFAGGAWNGTTGITSAAAGGDAKHLTALGVILNDNGSGTPLYGGSSALIASTFDGTTPADGDVLVKYTYYGDANLDGQVDGSDYTKIDAGYSSQTGSSKLTGWENGDFNYDGKIDGSDYTLIDNAFNTQAASLSAPIAASTAQIATTSAVPEPAAIGLIAVSLVAIIGRRKRHQ
jgi:hypothetical protein